MHEALSNSIPVIAYKRGCIEQFISDRNGKVINLSDNFVDKTEAIILKWVSDSDLFHTISLNALDSYLKKKKLNYLRLCNLAEKLLCND